jgi:hypothetical protein
LANIQLTPRQENALGRLEEKFGEVKSEIEEIGFIVQGSVTNRWKKCGKPACRCHEDPNEWHGPYYQWSWKTSGRTSSVSLSQEQAALCRQWVENNRKLERIIKRLRRLSLRAARVYEIARK